MSILHYNILDLSQYALMIIWHRHTDGIAGLIVNFISVTFATINNVLALWLLFNIDGGIDQLMKACETIITIPQVYFKMLPLVIYRQKIKQLFDSQKYFWDLDEFPTLNQQFKEIYKFTYYLLVGYQCAFAGTAFVFFVQPFYKYELFMICYIPKSIPYAFEMLLASQYYIAYILIGAMGGFDSMYIAFFQHLVVQFKCLNYAIENIDMNNSNFIETLRKYVDHQRFLLTFAQDLMTVFGISISAQYFFSTIHTFIELYMLRDSMEVMDLILRIIYMISLLTQFGLYCFTATEFSAEAERFSESTYFSQWYKGTPEQQKLLGFVIQRAQKEFKIMAAGLVEINRAAFITVVKTAVSCSTLMRQLRSSD